MIKTRLLAILTAMLFCVAMAPRASAVSATATQDMSTIFPGLGSQNGISSIDCYDSLIQLTTITLTPAQILALNATPITVIPAPGAGKTVFVDYVVARYTGSTTAYAAGGAVSLQYSAGNAVALTLPATTLTTTTSSDTILGPVATNTTAAANTAVTVSNATAAFTTGNGTLTLIIHYSVN